MATERVFFNGEAGQIETFIDEPSETTRGLALICHPHPKYGGTPENKIVQTLAKTFVELGYIAARPAFRGIGQSHGEYDKGVGETEDMVDVVAQAQARFGEIPLVLAGFSFGGYVQTRVAKQVTAQRLVLVAPACGYMNEDRDYDTETVPADTIVIHGEKDETVPLKNVLDWARPQDLPIIVVPNADHFFHHRLHLIKALVKGAWRP
ncbi:MAG TPA: alpha/beta family hydrolase [Burkholderiales bacterium]|nr:alpha/beta family hydrolase [Burkholderiales bacterium]